MGIKQYLATGAVVASLGVLSLGCGVSEAEMLKQRMEYESKLHEQEIKVFSKEIEKLQRTPYPPHYYPINHIIHINHT